MRDSRTVYKDYTQTNGVTPPIFRYYYLVFGAMYGTKFSLESATSIEELLQDVVGILDVCEYLDCIRSVSDTLNTAILGQGQILWRSVQANPFAWADLAMRLLSVSVFTEAIIHIAGRWNSLAPEEFSSLHPKIREICEDHYNKLQARLCNVEQRVLKFYPGNIQRPIGATIKQTSRMSYANDIMTWMALCIYRHWFATMLAIDAHRHSKDGGYKLYSMLAKGGDAYLTKSEINGFREKFPMSTRGEHVLDKHMERLKHMVTLLVAEVMLTELQLDTERYKVDYVTCTHIDKVAVQSLLGVGTEPEQATLEWTYANQPKMKGKRKSGGANGGEQELSGDEDGQPIVKKKKKSQLVDTNGDGGAMGDENGGEVFEDDWSGATSGDEVIDNEAVYESDDEGGHGEPGAGGEKQVDDHGEQMSEVESTQHMPELAPMI